MTPEPKDCQSTDPTWCNMLHCECPRLIERRDRDHTKDRDTFIIAACCVIVILIAALFIP